VVQGREKNSNFQGVKMQIFAAGRAKRGECEMKRQEKKYGSESIK